MLRAGAAEVEITPPPGVRLSGFSARAQPATDTLDPLFARALFVQGGDSCAALAVADVIGLDEELVRRVRDLVEREADLHPSAVMLAATHTHSGPSIMQAGLAAIRCSRVGSPDERAIELTANGIARAILAAARGAQPAAVGAASATGLIGVNRRRRSTDGRIEMQPNPEGPVDPDVGVLRVEGKQGPICVMLNHACHGVVLGPDNLRYSADWLGAAARSLREAVGGIAIVTNGACADINPIERDDIEAVGRQGAAIARIGLRAFACARVSSAARVRTTSCPVALPTRALSRDEAARELERCEENLNRALALEDAGAIAAWQFRRPWAQAMVELAATGAPPDPVAAEIQVIAVGETALVGLPGEVFVEIGMNIKARSPFPRTFVIGYANRSVGYLPTRPAFAEGGYEVELSHAHYGFPPFTPEVQDIVEGRALELLRSLR